MSRKATALYDFTLTAGGSFDLPVDASFYKILTSTGDISVTRDGGSTVKPMRAGRGERGVSFTKLTLRDLSGAPNSGTIIVGDSGFIDDTVVLSSSINIRPESPSGNFKSIAALAANTPETVIAPGTNTAGVIVLSLSGAYGGATTPAGVFIAKTSAPANIADGEVIAAPATVVLISASIYETIQLPKEQYLSAGLGLYFIATGGVSAGGIRACRFKAL